MLFQFRLPGPDCGVYMLAQVGPTAYAVPGAMMGIVRRVVRSGKPECYHLRAFLPEGALVIDGGEIARLFD